MSLPGRVLDGSPWAVRLSEELTLVRPTNEGHPDAVRVVPYVQTIQRRRNSLRRFLRDARSR